MQRAIICVNCLTYCPCAFASASAAQRTRGATVSTNSLPIHMNITARATTASSNHQHFTTQISLPLARVAALLAVLSPVAALALA